MAVREFNDFEIRLAPNTAVQAALSLSGESAPVYTFTGADSFPIDEVLERALGLEQLIHLTLASAAPCPTPVYEFGQYLYRTLFQGRLPGGLKLALKVSQRRGDGLRVRVHAPAAWHAVPWELLIDGDSGPENFLAQNRSVAMIRTVADAGAPVLGGIRLPLRVLIVVCAPSDRAPLDTGREIRMLLGALSDLIREGAIAVDFVAGANTAPRVAERLESQDCHILHWIGHGETDGGGVSIVMEDESRHARLVDHTSLWNHIQAARRPRLVVLNICKGAAGTPRPQFASLAHVFLRTNVPAVLAHQSEVVDMAAADIARLLYHALTRHGLDQAVIEARAGLTQGLSWYTPVLFLHYSHGELFLAAPGEKAVPNAGPLIAHAGAAAREERWQEAAAYAGAALLLNPDDPPMSRLEERCQAQQELDEHLLQARHAFASRMPEITVRRYDAYLAAAVQAGRPAGEREKVGALRAAVRALWGVWDPVRGDLQ